MLYLDTETSRPKHYLLYSKVEESMKMGVKIEIPTEFRARLEQDKKFLEHVFQTKHGVQNPNSSQQVQAKLSQLSIQYPEVESACYDQKKGTWTSRGDALEKISTSNIDFVNDLMFYRSVCALTKSFNSLEAAQDTNGFVHPTVSSQITNRVSYSNPGIMSIPKKVLWQVVRPRSEGWHIFRIDIKNQEPWIFINALKIEKLQTILKLSGDIGLYRMIYNDIYGHEPNDLQYKETKTTWNALTYGSSKKSILERTFHVGETNSTPSDNGRKIYEYFNSFPEIKEYQKRIRAMAYGSGARQVKTLFGVNIELRDCSPSQAARCLMDYWIQGTGTDILAFLVESLYDFIEKYHMEDHMRLYYPRHDEVTLEVSPEYMKNVGMKRCYDHFGRIFRHTINDWEPCNLEIEHIEPSYELTMEDFKTEA